mmetsp:Transcript_18606/g.20459  ORF Transcript_18606/g.20459 Transcript_18606/m.20459 type:complete len:121 (-) Transcript_18606:111-473(-)
MSTVPSTVPSTVRSMSADCYCPLRLPSTNHLRPPSSLALLHLKLSTEKRQLKHNIKHKTSVDHGVPNTDGEDTPVPNVCADELDAFVDGYYWEGGGRVEVLIEKAVLQSTKIKLEDSEKN